jgi:hypothetical protein
MNTLKDTVTINGMSDQLKQMARKFIDPGKKDISVLRPGYLGINRKHSSQYGWKY